MSQLFWTLRPPAGSCCLYTVDSPWIWTQPNINICLASFIVHLFKIIWDFFTSVGLGTKPLVAATMLAVNVSTNNRVVQGDICCISRSHYKIISHLSHQQVEVEARRANKAARPQFYSHLRLYVCKETCEHLVRYLSREDRHPDPWHFNPNHDAVRTQTKWVLCVDLTEPQAQRLYNVKKRSVRTHLWFCRSALN